MNRDESGPVGSDVVRELTIKLVSSGLTRVTRDRSFFRAEGVKHARWPWDLLLARLEWLEYIGVEHTIGAN